MKQNLDSIDRQLLALLQQDAETPLAELADAVHLALLANASDALDKRRTSKVPF